jgi:pyrimidine-nucleoside phosphorylase
LTVRSDFRMRVYDLIWKKREGGELTAEEIRFLISGYTRGEIPDYQMSAWCMAVFFKGMTFEECTALTMEMANSGERIDLSVISGIKVDKHSTGGVGDKTSLVILPLVAACGVPVAKISGRGLGHTGGTIDKLESIPGFKINLTREQFLNQVLQIGVALAGQTGNLVPADKKLYALRDLTATVESIPLIASSIVSKKLAAGADAVVLDVKFGNGAFIRDHRAALDLATTMVEIGKRAGRRFKAVITDMNQPLGCAIGNSLEVAEAIQTLQGEGPPDLTELSLVLGGYMVWLANRAETPEAGQAMVTKSLGSGQGLAKLSQLITAQGGNPAVIHDLALLPAASVIQPAFAREKGWIERIDCRALGLVAMKLGAGRIKLENAIKPEVGLKFLVKVGDYVEKGSRIAEIHAGNQQDLERAVLEVEQSYHLSNQLVKPVTLITETV